MRPLLPFFAVILASACAPPRVDQMVRIARVDDALVMVDSPVPAGLDLHRVSGPLGTALRGGKLDISEYLPGAPVQVDYVADRGVGVPLEEDGLVMWSFYAHLADAHQDLSARGFEVAPLVPFEAFAWSPASAMDFSAAENAAYAPTEHIFILFPDLVSAVPLAANDGVVRHELGHAYFQLLTTGAVGSLGPMANLSTRDTLETRAVNEGFADMLATLSLDDPAFIERSLPMPSRDVRGDAVATDGLYPAPSIEEELLGALSFNPYDLGTVLASFAWDLRLISNDPTATLRLVVDVAQAWGEGAHWGDADAFASLLAAAAIAEWPSEEAAICADFATRFPRAQSHALQPCL